MITELQDMSALSQDEQKILVDTFTPRWTKYLNNFEPYPKQAAFMCLEKLGVEEALYGGAAGGGKSFALWAAGLQYVDLPEEHGIIFRRSYTDLSLPGALMDVASEWLRGTDAVWDGMKKCWVFPSRATLGFGYLDTATDPDRYMSAAFSYIAFDEAGQIPWRWMNLVANSRSRKSVTSRAPLRIRYSANPGGIAHEDLKSYFVNPKTAKGTFIPANLDDNIKLDRVSYKRSLSKLDPISRQRLLDGNWDAIEKGTLFKRENVIILEEAPPLQNKYVRAYDFAATEEKKGNDPDWTVGVLMSQQPEGLFVVHDMRRFRCRPAEVEARIKQIAKEDGKSVPIHLEEEGGASGKIATEHYIRNVLPGYEVFGNRATGSKQVRAGPVASQVEIKNFAIVRGEWNRELLDEMEAFPCEGVHDDTIDACSLAFAKINEMESSVEDFGFTVYSGAKK